MSNRIVRLFRNRPMASPSARKCRLSIEPLEGREVPANFIAANVSELIADISTANSTPETDTITLVSGTTYSLNQVNNTTDGTNGLPVVASGENLSILGQGAIIERSTASGTPAFRLFDVAAGATLSVKNAVLQGGLALDPQLWDGGSDWSRGGAIYNRGTLNLDGVTLQNNTAQGQHGAWYLSSFPPGNGEGGAIYNDGVLSIVNSNITNNSSFGGRGLNALTATTPGGIADGAFLPNAGQSGGNGLGGGLYVAGGTVSISNSTITVSTAQGGKGGDGFVKKSGKTTAAGNGGDGLGGGLYAAAGTVNLHNVAVKQNHALGGLGGLGNPSSQAGVNGKGIGGGLYIEAAAVVGLDATTVNQTKKNDASTSHNNIRGTYDLIS